MSKVYKSSNVQIGSPKPIVNTFDFEIKQEMGSEAGQEIAAAREELGIKAEEAANNIIEDAKQMYLKIIEEANNEAQSIVGRAEADGNNLRLSAREEGFREGYASGYEEGKGAAGSIINEAIEIREFLDSRRDSLYRDAEEEILSLILEISKKVIGDELNNNQNAIMLLIKQALEKCAFKNKLVIRVSPEDYEFVSKSKDNICKLVECVSDIEIDSDPSLEKGGCIVETPSGEINASAYVQMKELEKVFLFTLRNE